MTDTISAVQFEAVITARAGMPELAYNELAWITIAAWLR